MRSYHHLQNQNPTTTGQWLNNHGKVGVVHFYHMVSSIKRLSLMFAAVSGLELTKSAVAAGFDTCRLSPQRPERGCSIEVSLFVRRMRDY